MFSDSPSPPMGVQRSRFLDPGIEFFVLALGRPLALDPTARSSVSIGFLLDNRCRRVLRFWNDPAIEQVDVNLTCERCALSEETCSDRAAPPDIVRQQIRQRAKQAALAELSSRS